MHSTRRFLFLLFLPVLFSACRGQAPPVDDDAAAQVYTAIQEQYDRIVARYDQMSADLPADMQAHYGQMRTLHDEAAPMHRHMMDGGMMGGRMMDGNGHMDWARLHTMDRRMRGLHAQMADSLHAHGYADMAAMHEQMTHYYDQALELTDENGP